MFQFYRRLVLSVQPRYDGHVGGGMTGRELFAYLEERNAADYPLTLSIPGDGEYSIDYFPSLDAERISITAKEVFISG